MIRLTNFVKMFSKMNLDHYTIIVLRCSSMSGFEGVFADGHVRGG